MRLQVDTPSTGYTIQSIEDGLITINSKVYRDHVLMSAEHLIVPWLLPSINHLSPEHLKPILEWRVEIFLLGTGQSHEFVNPALLAPLWEAHIGVECMTTRAACRTYTALQAEGRAVSVGLFMGDKFL